MYTLTLKEKISQKTNKSYIGLFASCEDKDIALSFDLTLIARLCKKSILDVCKDLQQNNGVIVL